MAILMDGKIHSAPLIAEPLPGGGVIRGHFTDDEVAELVRLLRTDSLGGPLIPVAQADSRR